MKSEGKSPATTRSRSDSCPRSYIRSIRERVTLEEFERKATRELREKIEQARINRRFFLSTRRTPEQQAKHIKMQHLISANLFNPPREYVVDEKHLVDYDVTDKALHAEALRALTLEDEEQLVTFDNKFAPHRNDELAVPSYRDISCKYPDSYLGYDPVQTDLYWSAYQAEYIVYDTDPIEMEVEPPLFQDKMPRRKHAEPSLRRANSAGVLPSDKVTRVSKFFHPHRWSKIELDWVRALLAVYGAEWPVISKVSAVLGECVTDLCCSSCVAPNCPQPCSPLMCAAAVCWTNIT